MRYSSLVEVMYLHLRIMDRSGGPQGVRDIGSLESALAQPKATFESRELQSDAAREGGGLLLGRGFSWRLPLIEWFPGDERPAFLSVCERYAASLNLDQ